MVDPDFYEGTAIFFFQNRTDMMAVDVRLRAQPGGGWKGTVWAMKSMKFLLGREGREGLLLAMGEPDTWLDPSDEEDEEESDLEVDLSGLPPNTELFDNAAYDKVSILELDSNGLKGEVTGDGEPPWRQFLA